MNQKNRNLKTLLNSMKPKTPKTSLFSSKFSIGFNIEPLLGSKYVGKYFTETTIKPKK